ncbi:MAG: UDP-N-acetylmuramoyl-L-alanyl-D-glutamate--2,6-diaminopimelate ligase [Burkholderiaceae bacterium]
MEQLRTPQHAKEWLCARVRGSLHTDSRKVRAGDGFIAWPGVATDGRRFVPGALDAGAAACMVEAEGVEVFGFNDARIASYPALKTATGLVAAEYYGHPSRAIDVLAVTGTNGKTSTAWWLAQALNTLHYAGSTLAHGGTKSKTPSLQKNELLSSYACGLVGTLGIGTPGQMVFNGLTTPDPVLLQAQFAQMKNQGVVACAIEASSIGLAEHRLAGTAIRTAIFTNLTQDHLDYHGSMQAYGLAKRALFDWPGLQAAVLNIDDSEGETLAQHCAARGVQVWTVSQLRSDATLCARAVQYTDQGMAFTVREGSQETSLDCTLVGEYNVSNLLGVIAALRSLGIDLDAACQAVSQCSAVPGRMQSLSQPNAPLVVVDYAHTPDALEKVLTALRPITQSRGGQLHCVFGCGGDRDAAKRPLMAAAAQRGATHIVVTSDNPRSEAPGTIIAQIVAGLSAPARAHVEPDRAQAIAHSIAQARAQDVVLIAGKGHEDYQDIAGTKHPFSDAVHAQTALTRRTGRPSA